MARRGLSEREAMRGAVLAQVAKGDWTLTEAAERMGVSYRQAKRMRKKYEKEGAAGLAHGNGGRKSNRAITTNLREKVLRLIGEKYGGEKGDRFGPTLVAEHLASEDNIEIGTSTLRRWMLEAGLWSRERKVREHRSRRSRKDHFGELVQLDGSFHEWLEGRGPRGCLMNLVDDATGITLCRMGDQETIWAAVGVVRAWMEKYGVMRALYTDWKNVYVREPTAKEKLHGTAAQTQFGRMCAGLGIKIIAAGSPQAKGRVERNHGTHQDRLVKKLRRKDIGSHGEVNEYLETEYCDEHNQRFAVEPKSEIDYHLPAPGKKRLREIFRLETERVVGNDWVVQHDNHLYQLERSNRVHAPAKSKVMVCQWEDEAVEIHYRGQSLKYREITERPVKLQPEKVKRQEITSAAAKTADHPWRKRYQDMKPLGPQR